MTVSDENNETSDSQPSDVSQVKTRWILNIVRAHLAKLTLLSLTTVAHEKGPR